MNKIFANKIKELRTESGLSQEQLAEKMNIKRYQLSNWEQGRVQPSLEDLVMLSNFFGVTTDYLLGLED